VNKFLICEFSVSQFVFPVPIFLYGEAELLRAGTCVLERVLRAAFLRQKTGSLHTGCFKKSFTTLKAYINVFRRHIQCFERPYCSKILQVLPGIVTSTGNAGCLKKLCSGIPNVTLQRLLRKRLYLKVCKLSIIQHLVDGRFVRL
jgi:hypothetical protein